MAASSAWTARVRLDCGVGSVGLTAAVPASESDGRRGWLVGLEAGASGPSGVRGRDASGTGFGANGGLGKSGGAGGDARMLLGSLPPSEKTLPKPLPKERVDLAGAGSWASAAALIGFPLALAAVSSAWRGRDAGCPPMPMPTERDANADCRLLSGAGGLIWGGGWIG